MSSCRPLQAVILDFDGVIANSEPLHLRAFQQTLGERGIELSADDYYGRYLGFDDVGMVSEVARDRGLSITPEEVAGFVARKATNMQQLIQAGMVLFPGVDDFVRRSAAEVPLAIASGALRHEILEIIDAAELGACFSIVVAAGDTPQSKPSPEPYQLAFARLCQQTGLDLDPRRCVAIEDSRWGLASARGAGLRCVGVTNSYRAEELPGAELIVSSLAGLTLEMLDSLCAQDTGT